MIFRVRKTEISPFWQKRFARSPPTVAQRPVLTAPLPRIDQYRRSLSATCGSGILAVLTIFQAEKPDFSLFPQKRSIYSAHPGTTQSILSVASARVVCDTPQLNRTSGLGILADLVAFSPKKHFSPKSALSIRACGPIHSASTPAHIPGAAEP